MSRQPPGPLTEEHFAQLQQALDVAKFAENEVERAKRAGIDVADSEQRLRDAKAKLQQIKQVYFPGR